MPRADFCSVERLKLTQGFIILGVYGVGMARRVHEEGLRERRNQQNHDPSGKYDVGYWNDSGDWVHICRYSDKSAAESACERLSDPSPQEQELIGLPESPDTKVIAR